MAKAKKVVKKAVKKEVKKVAKAPAKKQAVKSIAPEKLAKLSYEELVSANLTALTQTLGNLSDAVDVLSQKMESMAYHIIAVEGILSEVVASTGIDISNVNCTINAKISAGTDGKGSPNRAIDIAAGIMAPLPKKKKK